MIRLIWTVVGLRCEPGSITTEVELQGRWGAPDFKFEVWTTVAPEIGQELAVELVPALELGERALKLQALPSPHSDSDKGAADIKIAN